jgi:hypothetical protein
MPDNAIVAEGLVEKYGDAVVRRDARRLRTAGDVALPEGRQPLIPG